jgi:hypothetical protein
MHFERIDSAHPKTPDAVATCGGKSYPVAVGRNREAADIGLLG